ncbi:MAG: MerR family DNA-binding transcriptional regulator [Coxiellaceae bacterium]|nr:MerR family DNA-binding transcriptional regulator [Coxiellaceae bacterium]
MKNTKKLTIGQLAKLSNVSIATIRHYESLGLLKACSRSASNYRLYTAAQTATLDFIFNAKSVGLNLNSIKELIEYSEQKKPGAAFKKKMENHLTEINNKIAELQNFQKIVKSLLDSCDGSMPFAECPIVKKLHSNKPK